MILFVLLSMVVTSTPVFFSKGNSKVNNYQLITIFPLFYLAYNVDDNVLMSVLFYSFLATSSVYGCILQLGYMKKRQTIFNELEKYKSKVWRIIYVSDKSLLIVLSVLMFVVSVGNILELNLREIL